MRLLAPRKPERFTIAFRLCKAKSDRCENYEALKTMKYEDYHLPSGVDLSSITYEDIRWQYGVFRCNIMVYTALSALRKVKLFRGGL